MTQDFLSESKMLIGKMTKSFERMRVHAGVSSGIGGFDAHAQALTALIERQAGHDPTAGAVTPVNVSTAPALKSDKSAGQPDIAALRALAAKMGIKGYIAEGHDD